MEEKKAPKLRFEGFNQDWEQLKFSEVLKVNSGRDYKHLEEGDIPVYGTGGYMLSVNDKLSDIDGIGIGRKGTINKPQYLKAPYWTVDTLFYITAKKGYNLNFLYSMVQRINWKRMDESTGVPSLSKNVIEKVHKEFPSYDEQAKIGFFFKQLDDALALHQRKIEKLQLLKQAFLQKMFVNQGHFPEVRFAEFSREWEQRKLGELTKVTSVKRIHQSDWTDSGVRFLRARDIVSKSKNEEPADYLYISQEKYNEYSKLSGKVSPGDLLVTGVGTIGVPLLIIDNTPVYFKDGNIIWFKNEKKIEGYFFYYSFINNTIQKYIRDVAGVGTVGTYTIDSGKKTPIALPIGEEQQKIGSFFKQLDVTIALHQKKLTNLKQLKKAFLQSMFI